MSYQSVFERHEIKYMISRSQRQAILEALSDRVRPDEYGLSTIRNLYYDTPTFALIRHSLEKPEYKEKLRLRTYRAGDRRTQSYVELKKKYDGVVYKRRIGMPLGDAMQYLQSGICSSHSQISRELGHFLILHPDLQPKVALFYDRQALYSREDPHFRLTFDENIRWRTDRLDLSETPDGTPLLAPDHVLLELKAAAAIPLWMVKLLSEMKIYPTSFSKYGTVYAENLSHLVWRKNYA